MIKDFLHKTTDLYKRIYKPFLPERSNSEDLDLWLFQAEEHRQQAMKELDTYLSDFLVGDLIRIWESYEFENREIPSVFAPYLDAFATYIRSNGYRRQSVFRCIPEIERYHIRNFFEVQKIFRCSLAKQLPKKDESVPTDGYVMPLTKEEFVLFATAMKADVLHEGFDEHLSYRRMVDVVCVLTFLQTVYG